MIKNIMSVDLEDYYCDLPFSQWNKFDDRVVETTRVILKLFDRYNVRATFFALGYIVEKHPDLIEEIKSKGHEIASHGYLHKDLRKMTKEEFESDLVKSLDIIRKISGEKVLGFRAPYFSIDKKNFWAFEIMKKYLSYDSSIFPVKTPLYGIPEAPRYM
ncbi:MAG: polysaccharide deacetylase family protein, partial [Nitrosotalea sp.]